MTQKKNHPQLTAINRTAMSLPARFMRDNNLLKGHILDFGCGHGFDTTQLKKEGYDITGYDKYYNKTTLEEKYDTIICIYVLNVIETIDQTDVLMTISQLLKPTGKAYFAVRRDLKEEGYRLHAIYKQYTYQCNVILPYKSITKNKGFEIYEYRHYNQLEINNKALKSCPFCSLDSSVELISETASCVAFYDKYPVSPGHALIIPKRHVSDYFQLTNHEKTAMQLLLNRVKQIITKRYNPDGYNIGVNIGEAAGQSVFHVHMHLIPRYKGDVPNPKGGVRGVIPNKQKY